MDAESNKKTSTSYARIVDPKKKQKKTNTFTYNQSIPLFPLMLDNMNNLQYEWGINK